MQPGSAHQTFYQQISANRRRSLVLVAILTAVLAVFGFVIGFAMSGGYWQGGVVATVIAVAIAMLMTSVSYFAGDGIVLGVSGARQIDDSVAPQLMNVVRELAIAANVPMPRVYLINDTAPNAFATGRDPGHASVAVTTGLLEKLDREELQGVIGHELSHVRNLDIRFALLVGVLVGSIALLSDFFLRFTFWGGLGGRGNRRGGGGGGLVIVAIVIGLILAVIAPFVARLVQLAVSRQREYLADSSSVELTRNPYGLERALAKISSDREVLEVANRATQHLYLVNPIKKWESRAAGLMATHPPIVDRINRLRALSGEGPMDPQSLQALSGLD